MLIMLLLLVPVFREANGPKIFHIVLTHTSQNRSYNIHVLLKAANQSNAVKVSSITKAGLKCRI
jgi:hypothetical protein